MNKKRFNLPIIFSSWANHILRRIPEQICLLGINEKGPKRNYSSRTTTSAECCGSIVFPDQGHLLPLDVRTLK
jgi:hypothetical protein